jgi:hypothetical protein
LHKIRQQRYLQRKMTHKGSHSDGVGANCAQAKEDEGKAAAIEPGPSGEPLKRPQARARPEQPEAVYCHFCGRLCLPGNRRTKLPAVVRRERRSARHQYG